MIVVVGAGMTGLATALELRDRSIEVVVVEASGRAGGVVWSHRQDGRVLDFGPQRLRLTPDMIARVRGLDLEDRLVLAPPNLPLLVYARGALRPVPMSLAALARSDVVGWRAKLRLALEPLTASPRAGESVGAFLSRKLGRGLYATVAGPLFGGLYGSDPDDMPVEASLIPVLRTLGVRRSLLAPLLRRGGGVRPPPAASFREGMQELPSAMAARLGDGLRLSAPARCIHRRGQRWIVDLDAESLEAEAVVVTTPAHAAAELVAEAAPEAAAELAALRYNPLAVVHLESAAPLLGIGFQIAFGEQPMLLRGVTFNACLFGREGVYTAFLGGSARPEVAGMTDGALGAAAASEFERCTGYAARVLSVAHQRMPAWDRSWDSIAAPRLPPGLHLAGNWRSRPGLAGRFAEARAVATRLAAVAGAPVTTAGRG